MNTLQQARLRWKLIRDSFISSTSFEVIIPSGSFIDWLLKLNLISTLLWSKNSSYYGEFTTNRTHTLSATYTHVIQRMFRKTLSKFPFPSIPLNLKCYSSIKCAYQNVQLVSTGTFFMCTLYTKCVKSACCTQNERTVLIKLCFKNHKDCAKKNRTKLRIKWHLFHQELFTTTL